MDEKSIEVLKLFHRQAEKLRSNEDFFKNVKLSLNFKLGKGVKSDLARPDDKSIKATLVDLRLFLLEGEPINFYKICNLLYRNVSELELKKKIEKARDSWSILLERKKKGPVGGLRLRLGHKDILSETNLNAWLYGEHFHLDEEKREILEQMNLMPPFRDFSLFQFIDLLQRLSFLVFYLDKQVVENVLK